MERAVAESGVMEGPVMDIELCDEAAEYGKQAMRALEAAGGDKLVQEVEREPDLRGSVVAGVLNELGAWELDPRGAAAELEAAAALCRGVGYWAVAYPIAERLTRPADLPVDGLVVVAAGNPAGAVANLDLRWAAVDLDGRRSIATPRPDPAGPRRSAFVAPLDLAPADEQDESTGRADAALGLTLSCWTLLGMLDRAIELATAHVLVRKQFGQQLSAFQSVQFQLTDAEVERSGVDVLARYALWSVQVGNEAALDDALALRLAAVEAADTVFRVAHQLHGAIGFCDETTLSWLSRYSRPLRQLPLGLSATQAALTDRIGRRGLSGLYSDPMGA
jgi:hypothetical protein